MDQLEASNRYYSVISSMDYIFAENLRRIQEFNSVSKNHFNWIYVFLFIVGMLIGHYL
jgi:hypothetical protein